MGFLGQGVINLRSGEQSPELWFSLPGRDTVEGSPRKGHGNKSPKTLTYQRLALCLYV